MTAAHAEGAVATCDSRPPHSHSGHRSPGTIQQPKCSDALSAHLEGQHLGGLPVIRHRLRVQHHAAQGECNNGTVGRPNRSVDGNTRSHRLRVQHHAARWNTIENALLPANTSASGYDTQKPPRTPKYLPGTSQAAEHLVTPGLSCLGMRDTMSGYLPVLSSLLRL